MSGRPYARNLRAPFAGATDLEAVLPHSFRISAPSASSDAKQRAIRSAIRRRCVEKNWKKMFSMRRRRLAREEEQEEEQATPTPVEETPSPEDKARAEEAERAEEQRQEEEESKERQRQDEERLAAAKLKLEELKAKLAELTDQKHAKFLLLKQMLVQEARSKSSAPGSAGNASKKRRLDDAGGFSPLPGGGQSADASASG